MQRGVRGSSFGVEVAQALLAFEDAGSPAGEGEQ